MAGIANLQAWDACGIILEPGSPEETTGWARDILNDFGDLQKRRDKDGIEWRRSLNVDGGTDNIVTNGIFSGLAYRGVSSGRGGEYT